MRTLTNNETKVKSYKIHLMEMVINAIYYNPVRCSNRTAIFLTLNFLGFGSPRSRIKRIDK
jgi:hypothetical protein